MGRGAPARAAVAALALGCGAACAAPAGPPALELGAGRAAFEALADGQDVPMVEGSQGGFHLWVSVRVEGAVGEGAELTLEASPLATGRPRQTLRLPPRLEEGAPAEMAGIALVLSRPECFRDREVLLEAELADAAGLRLRDAAVVVPRWPADLGACDRGGGD